MSDGVVAALAVLVAFLVAGAVTFGFWLVWTLAGWELTPFTGTCVIVTAVMLALLSAWLVLEIEGF